MASARQIKRQMAKQQPASEKPNTLGMTAQMADPNTSGKVNQGKIRQLEDITALFMKLIHGDQTRESVLGQLKANPDPAEAIVATSNVLMSRVEGQMRQKKTKLPNDIKMAVAQYVVHDLAAVGNAAKAWETNVSQEELPQILQDTMQTYIEKGIRDKSIDPIAIQSEAEALMTPEQRKIGMEMGGGRIPEKPTATMAARQYADKRVDAETQKTQKAQMQAKKYKTALQGQQQQQQPQEQ